MRMSNLANCIDWQEFQVSAVKYCTTVGVPLDDYRKALTPAAE
jgi:hypothetical protein